MVTANKAQRKPPFNLYRVGAGGWILVSQQINDILRARWLCNEGGAILQESGTKYGISAEPEPDYFLIKELSGDALVRRYFWCVRLISIKKRLISLWSWRHAHVPSGFMQDDVMNGYALAVT